MTLPVSIDDAKAQLRLDSDSNDQDPEVESFIADAASWVENYTGHILEARMVTERFDSFERIGLRAWPVAPDAAVTVAYTAAGSASTPIIGARLNVSRRPARLLAPAGQCWPCASADVSVVVTFRAGYETPADAPRNFRRAMLVLIGAYDADREGGDILAAAESTAAKLCSRLRARTL